MSDPVEPEPSDDRRSARGGVGVTLMGWGLGIAGCAFGAAMVAWGVDRVGAELGAIKQNFLPREEMVELVDPTAMSICRIPEADQKTLTLVRMQDGALDPGAVTPPEWVTRPTPIYPNEALRQGVRSGAVTVACIISHQGPPDACRVESETPPELGFAEAALMSLCGVEIKPPTVNGEPHRTVVVWTIRFATGE